jgi:hypothetical protein
VNKDVMWKPAPPEMEAAVDDALGLRAISIRLPVTLIDAFKSEALRRGVLYQPLMRQALREWIAAPPSTPKQGEGEWRYVEDASVPGGYRLKLIREDTP